MKHKKSKLSKSKELTSYSQSTLQLDNPLEELETGFAVLCEICRLVKESPLEEKTCEQILKLIGRSIEYSSASIFWLDKTKNQIEELSSVGKKVDLIDFVKFNIGSGFSAWVAMEKRPILLPNLRRKRFRNGIRSFLSVPLTLKEDLFGVINLSHIKPNAFGSKELKFLNLIVSPIALGMERMFCQSEMEKKEKELEVIRSYLREIQNELLKMEKGTSLSQLLRHLDRKIKNPLLSITENAQFLLDSVSSKSSNSTKSFDSRFKRKLREITTEANQISKATEKLLQINAQLMASGEDQPRHTSLEHLLTSAKQA